LVKDRNDLQSRTVERPIVESVGEPMQHHAPEVVVHERKGDGVFPEQVLGLPQCCLKSASETRLLTFIPSSSRSDVVLRFESVEDLHWLRLTVQASVHLLRGYVLRRWISRPAVQLPFVPLRHGNLAGVGGKTIPDVLDELEPLAGGQSHDLIAQRLWGHNPNLNGTLPQGKMVVGDG
jgi:hypothetical protein